VPKEQIKMHFPKQRTSPLDEQGLARKPAKYAASLSHCGSLKILSPVNKELEASTGKGTQGEEHI
jgi:hypothetical protein